MALQLALFTSFLVFVGCVVSWSDEMQALLLFKDKHLMNCSALRSWKEGDASPCKWRGVRCNEKSGRVTTLVLDGLALAGTISGTIGELQELEMLSLARNRLRGDFPEAITRLGNLRKVNVSYNELSGSLPALFARAGKMEHLDFSFNDFSGHIPDQMFSSNPYLRSVRMVGNQLQGDIPADLYACDLLSSINLSANRISGSISEEIRQLRQLRFLDLSWNDISGGIPLGISGLLYLNHLRLAGNKLSGQIPAGFSKCADLQVLDLSCNDLSGSLPFELHTLASLQDVNLGKNYLSGGIPSWISSWSSLVVLNLAENMFSGGDVLLYLANCSALSVLNVSGNSLHSWSFQAGHLKSLRILDVSNNLLNGSIPRNLCASSRISSLQAHHNLLSGNIPADLQHCIWLSFLDLSYNRLSGAIPTPLGKLKNLLLINVSHNQLYGAIPDTTVFRSMNPTSYAGNAGLCGPVINVSCPTSSTGLAASGMMHHSKQAVVTICVIVAICVAVAVALGAVVVAGGSKRWQQKSRRIRMVGMPESWSVGKLCMFPGSRRLQGHLLLDKDSKVGHGGFGNVYRVVLPDGHLLAVKMLLPSASAISAQQFKNNVEALGKMRHPSLVSLRGYYWTQQMQLLLYDYIPHGDLGSRLHGRQTGQPCLSWCSRFHIAKGTASALAYLHRNRIIHHNVKTSNVLLHAHNSPKLSDAGMSKLVARAPQLAAAASSILSLDEKSDVFGFGVLILELVTGRKPVEYVQEEMVVLCDQVADLLHRGCALDCVDPSLNVHLLLREQEELLLHFIKLGLVCASRPPSHRPAMAEVVQMLDLMEPLVA